MPEQEKSEHQKQFEETVRRMANTRKETVKDGKETKDRKSTDDRDDEEE